MNRKNIIQMFMNTKSGKICPKCGQEIHVKSGWIKNDKIQIACRHDLDAMWFDGVLLNNNLVTIYKNILKLFTKSEMPIMFSTMMKEGYKEGRFISKIYKSFNNTFSQKKQSNSNIISEFVEQSFLVNHNNLNVKISINIINHFYIEATILLRTANFNSMFLNDGSSNIKKVYIKNRELYDGLMKLDRSCYKVKKIKNIDKIISRDVSIKISTFKKMLNQISTNRFRSLVEIQNLLNQFTFKVNNPICYNELLLTQMFK